MSSWFYSEWRAIVGFCAISLRGFLTSRRMPYPEFARSPLLLRYPLAGVVRQIALIPDQMALPPPLGAVQPILHEGPAVAFWALMA